MFTGIIEAVGSIESLSKGSDGLHINVDTDGLDLSDVTIGDSIAINGVCLTAVKLSDKALQADVSEESLARTTLSVLKAGDKVNLEKAMRADARFGGHMVSGHVDGLGEVVSREQGQKFARFVVKAPAPLTRYIAEKGSICVDGISLTVNALEGNQFALTIVPHTLSQTIMDGYKPGQKVNLEVDLIARYIERLMQADSQTAADSAINTGFLARHGFIK